MPPDAPQSPSPDIALLLRFLAGESTDSEQQVVDRWLRDDPRGERADFLESLRRGGRPVEPVRSAATVGHAWTRMRRAMAETPPALRIMRPQKRPLSGPRPAFPVLTAY